MVELVVVMGIITLLIAVLAPALQRARGQARAVLCSSNIRQLVLGLNGYSINNGTYPYSFADDSINLMLQPPGGFVGNNAYDRRGWWWFHYISGYVGQDFHGDSILRCPSRCTSDVGIRENPLWGNYGVNQYICKNLRDTTDRAEFVGRPLGWDRISRPAEVLLVTDCGYSVTHWWHATDSPPSPLGDHRRDAAYIPGLSINQSKTLWPGQENDALNGRHVDKRVNVGFVDGHVKQMKADSLYVEQVDEDYRNLSPLWRPPDDDIH